jgi:hypothetical protein
VTPMEWLRREKSTIASYQLLEVMQAEPGMLLVKLNHPAERRQLTGDIVDSRCRSGMRLPGPSSLQTLRTQ